MNDTQENNTQEVACADCKTWMPDYPADWVEDRNCNDDGNPICTDCARKADDFVNKRLVLLRQTIRAEMEKAARRFGPFTSSHEALGVLLEEVDIELKAAIHANDLDAIRREAIQVAAVAARLAECCDDEAFRKRSVP